MELYDLRVDPREQNNLADRRPERLARLHDRLEREWQRLEPVEGGASIEIDEEMRERLRALGYAE